MYATRLKRVFDLACILPGLVVMAPMLAVLGMLVRIRLGSPVLFRQQRPGRHGKPFVLLKFRTMSEDMNAAGQLLPDADRLSSLGRFLRSTSMDELPELLNVLHGEMSLVGPRPLLMQYLPRYSQAQARRHDVRPGITGWAQVNGRNSLPWEEKFRLDVWYVDHISFWLDVKILWMTLLKVIRREGVGAEGHITMPEFMGTTGDER
jgi:sugar transferase EpsL